MDLSDEEIMARIIHKLYRRGNWGRAIHHLRTEELTEPLLWSCSDIPTSRNVLHLVHKS